MCFFFGLDDRGKSFLKVSADILLLMGQPTSAGFAAASLRFAYELIQRGSVSGGSILLKQSLVYDSGCLGYHLVRYELDLAQSHYVAAIWDLVDWFHKALTIPWYRMIILSNIGLLALNVFLLAVLGAALALSMRYMESLVHFVSEYLQAKGLMLSVPLAVLLGLIFCRRGSSSYFLWSALVCSRGPNGTPISD